jgi:hypothetical protein
MKLMNGWIKVLMNINWIWLEFFFEQSNQILGANNKFYPNIHQLKSILERNVLKCLRCNDVDGKASETFNF